MVAIHGNYCGANWTHGKSIPASDYYLYPEVKPTDRLDRACQAHDRSCVNGCTAAGDRRLRNAALMIAATEINPIIRAKALAVAAAMEAVSRTRSR